MDKVPEWREVFYVRGLFIPVISEIFDGIYVGTESREGTRRYGAFFTARMVRELAGGITGVWFDTYNGLFSWWEPLTVETYLEQLFESIAVLPPEVTLFCLEDLLHPSRHQLVEAVKRSWGPLREAVIEVQGEPVGVLKPSFQPGFSPVDDRYVEDYIGMVGVPLVPVNPDSIPEGSCVLVTAKEVAALDIESLSSKARAVLLTSGAVRRLVNRIRS